jgi:SSS family solute:Na+ symporter
VYFRFIDPNASEKRLIWIARGSVVLLAAIGAGATMSMDSIADAWKLLATISAGTGLIGLLRWLWWRINAWTEIAVMSASLVGANVVAMVSDVAFPFSLLIVVALSLPIAFAVTFLTSPEDPAVLQRFYERVQPAGAWSPVARALGVPNKRLGLRPWLEVAAATLGIYAAIAGVGWLLLGEPAKGIAACATSSLFLYFAIRGASQTGEPNA